MFKCQVLNLKFGFEAWETGLLRLGEPLGASWGKKAGPPAAPGLQEIQ